MEFVRSSKRTSITPFLIAVSIFVAPQFVTGTEEVPTELRRDDARVALNDDGDLFRPEPTLEELFVFGDIGPPDNRVPAPRTDAAYQEALDAAIGDSEASPLQSGRPALSHARR